MNGFEPVELETAQLLDGLDLAALQRLAVALSPLLPSPNAPGPCGQPLARTDPQSLP